MRWRMLTKLCDNHFAIYVSHAITVSLLKVWSSVCQLRFSKTGEDKRNNCVEIWLMAQAMFYVIRWKPWSEYECCCCRVLTGSADGIVVFLRASSLLFSSISYSERGLEVLRYIEDWSAFGSIRSWCLRHIIAALLFAAHTSDIALTSFAILWCSFLSLFIISVLRFALLMLV